MSISGTVLLVVQSAPLWYVIQYSTVLYTIIPGYTLLIIITSNNSMTLAGLHSEWNEPFWVGRISVSRCARQGIKHQISISNGKFIDDQSFKFYPRLPILNLSKGVETSRNLLCEIGPLNGDREGKNTPFSGKTSTTPYDAVCLETDPFRRFFWTRVRSKSYGEWPPGV